MDRRLAVRTPAPSNPSMPNPAKPSRDIADLLEIMRILRSPDGCPWDRTQTFETIAPYTVEEAYEVAASIEDRDYKALPDECQLAARWKSIEVLPSRDNRKPVISVIDAALLVLMTKAGIVFPHGSISHEKEHCVALVVLE